MGNIKGLVLFDLDGTLIDTAPDLVRAANHLRTMRGIPPLPFEYIRDASGKGARGLIRAALRIEKGVPSYAKLEKEFLDFYSTHLLDHVKPFDGILDLLSALTESGYAYGIVTNKPTGLALPVIKHVFGSTFEKSVFVGGDAPGKTKPHPDHLLCAMDKVQIGATHTVYVGDDQRDIAAAHAASMTGIAAAWGYTGGLTAVKSWNADAIALTPAELFPLIKMLLK